MGTRHLICIVKDKDYKIAQSGAWDGYPKGQGQDIINFLQNDFNKAKLEENLMTRVKPIEFAKNPRREHRSLQIGTGAEILKIIQDAQEDAPTFLNLSFAKDSLFCEWAYVLDLDQDCLEVHKGFNKKPLEESERFYSKNPDDQGYFPVKLVCKLEIEYIQSLKEFLLGDHISHLLSNKEDSE